MQAMWYFSLVPLLDRLPRLRPRIESLMERRLPTRVPVSPTYAQVEIINRCNLRCVMCSIAELTAARSRKVLDLDGFRAIVEQLPALKRVDLQGIGEPLLNPHLEAIIAWCRSRGLEVGFVTNGLLFDPARSESILRAGPQWMVFSLDSADPERYAQIRPRADLHKLLDNIRLVVATRARLAQDGPHLGIMTVAMQSNLHELPTIVDTVAALGVDGLTIKGVNTRPNPGVGIAREDEPHAAIAEAVARHPELQVTVAFANDRSRLSCRWPWSAVYVTAEGDLTPCCNCPDARDQPLGNLHQTPFATLWNGPAYRSFRAELRDGMPEICRQCPDY